MLFNRITPVVSAIFVVICLLVSNTTGIPSGRHRFDSSHLMTRIPNNDSWLALTSQGVRQLMFGRSMPTSQSITYSHKPNIESKNVIHSDSDAGQNVNQHGPNKFPITQENRLKWPSQLPLPYHDNYNKLKNSSRSLFKSILQMRRHVGLSDNRIIAHSNGNQLNPVNLLTSSPSRNSQRHRRSIEEKTTTEMPEKLDFIANPFWIKNRCSGGRIELMEGRFNAAKRSAKTHFVLFQYNVSGQILHGISTVEEKRFMCFNQVTRKVHPKDCFDPVNCAFKRIPTGMFYQFQMVYPPHSKLSFNNKGRQIRFSSSNDSVYNQNSTLRCRQFYLGTDYRLDWEKTGELLFKKEIKEDPKLIRYLEHPSIKQPPLCEPGFDSKSIYKRPNSTYKKRKDRKKFLAERLWKCDDCNKNSKSSTRSKHKVRHIKSKYSTVSS